MIVDKSADSVQCKKYQARNLFFDEKFADEAKDFIEAFMDDKVKASYITEQPSNEGLTSVRAVSGTQFSEEFVNNKDIKHCLLELKKNDCPACFFMGKLTDVLSLKMEKHGYLSNSGLPIFRMNNKNGTQFLGHSPYTPMYIYLKKSPITGKLTEIRTINTNPRDEKFLQEVARAGKLGKPFLEKVKMDVDAQL